jgi:ligand-binding sensor domain-containing protein
MQPQQPFQATDRPLRRLISGINTSADNNIPAVWKGTANGFPGLSAHNYGMSGGNSFKIPQVFRNMPEKLVVTSDGAVAGNCHYN